MMKTKHETTKSLSYFPSSSSTLSIINLLCCLTFLTLPTSTLSTILHSNETDRIALLDFKHRISHDPRGVLLNSWNDSVHHCRWQGVSCGPRHQRVVALRLPEKGLVGTISPHIGNLTFLRDFNLSGNGLYGQVPSEIGKLLRLRSLNLFANALTGELAGVNLSSCVRLEQIVISRNGLHGRLPVRLSSLKKLRSLRLGRNHFTGGIPPSFANLSSLQFLGLDENHLGGSVPNEISELWGLNILLLDANNLTGTLSSSLFNITSVRVISITDNSLQGTIPSSMGDTMPNLKVFYISGNKFHGAIPVSFPNASNLRYFEVAENYFVGKVPVNVGKLKHLVNFNLEANFLGGNGPLEDLAFIPSLANCSNLQIFSITRNRLEGKLSNAIGNFSSQLTYLGMGENGLLGTIPIGIKNLIGLIALMLGNNLLSGGIPSEIGDLKNLQGLGLNYNGFIGEIPSTLFNLTSLTFLYLEHNNFDGNIPSNVGNFWNLNELYLSHNKFNGTITQQVFALPSLSMVLALSDNSFIGPLSPDVGKLKTLSVLDISKNKLLGQIPESLGDYLTIQYLDLHANHLEGKIPHSLISLRNIRYLDLSNNKLCGEIPKGFQKLLSLKHLNLSFNDLEGEVPTVGVFTKANSISLLGNKKLCGGIPELKLPPCPMKTRKHRKHLKLLEEIFICVSIALVLASFLAFLTLYLRKGKERESTKLFKVEKLSKVSYSDLHRATEGFHEKNLIGSGSFGSVYKGRFEQGGEQIIAIKVLDLLKSGASKSFLAECKVLRNIRHRNLVPILTCCSSIDFVGNAFKALVYEFMENGDLDMWLHTHSNINARTNVLSVLQRLNIAIDVASALHYLHNDCEPMIIHCDLKPSNILLDKELAAHVGDFGISRLYSRTIEDSFEDQPSTFGLKGSIGYVPPECGTGAKASAFGDVYSYGILLLEMFTAKRPTDDLFNNENTSLYEYVEMALPEQVMKIVDPFLLACLENSHGIAQDVELDNHSNLVKIEESKMHSFFLSIFKIGLSCASISPTNRLHMKDVTGELEKIKKAFFV